MWVRKSQTKSEYSKQWDWHREGACLLLPLRVWGWWRGKRDKLRASLWSERSDGSRLGLSQGDLRKERPDQAVGGATSEGWRGCFEEGGFASWMSLAIGKEPKPGYILVCLASKAPRTPPELCCWLHRPAPSHWLHTGRAGPLSQVWPEWKHILFLSHLLPWLIPGWEDSSLCRASSAGRCTLGRPEKHRLEAEKLL